MTFRTIYNFKMKLGFSGNRRNLARICPGSKSTYINQSHCKVMTYVGPYIEDYLREFQYASQYINLTFNDLVI